MELDNDNRLEWTGKKVIGKLLSHSKATTLSQLATKLNIRTSILEDTQKMETVGASFNHKLINAVRTYFPELMTKFGWRGTGYGMRGRHKNNFSNFKRPIRLAKMSKPINSTLLPVPVAEKKAPTPLPSTPPPPKHRIISPPFGEVPARYKPLNPPTPDKEAIEKLTPTTPWTHKDTQAAAAKLLNDVMSHDSRATSQHVVEKPSQAKPSASSKPDEATASQASKKQSSKIAERRVKTTAKPVEKKSAPENDPIPSLFDDVLITGQETLLSSHIKLIDNSLKLTKAVLDMMA